MFVCYFDTFSLRKRVAKEQYREKKRRKIRETDKKEKNLFLKREKEKDNKIKKQKKLNNIFVPKGYNDVVEHLSNLDEKNSFEYVQDLLYYFCQNKYKGKTKTKIIEENKTVNIK